MLEYMPACKGVKRLPGHGHRLRLAFSSTTGLCVCVYLAVPQRGQFTVLQLVATDNNRYSLEHISTLFSTQVNARAEPGGGPRFCVCGYFLHSEPLSVNRRRLWTSR